MRTPEVLLVDVLGSPRAGPRSYDEVMEAWRPGRPRLPVGDAADLGLVRRGRNLVALTEAGRDRLEARS